MERPTRLIHRAHTFHPLFHSSFLRKTPRNTSFSSLRMTQTRHQVIYAPSDEPPRGVKSIFLAGTTSKVDDDTGDWRETLAASLPDVSVTVYNPYRADWDSSWREDITFAPYREQVEWGGSSTGRIEPTLWSFSSTRLPRRP